LATNLPQEAHYRINFVYYVLNKGLLQKTRKEDPKPLSSRSKLLLDNKIPNLVPHNLIRKKL